MEQNKRDKNNFNKSIGEQPVENAESDLADSTEMRNQSMETVVHVVDVSDTD